MSNKHGSHWLEREDFGGVTVVRLKTPKAPDEDTIRAVFEPIYSLVGEVGRNQLVLNLAAVEHLPSLAVGKLVMLNRKVQATNGRLALCHLTPGVMDTLESARLTGLFTICATEEEALKSFS
jgi:anti-sigma B factor antagonist